MKDLTYILKELYEALDEVVYKYGTNDWNYELRKKTIEALRKADKILKDCDTRKA